jgi:hypothetical protein
VHSAIDRPVTELTALKPDKFPVVYWARFPSVNIPLDFQPPYLPIFLVSLLLLISAPYFALFGRRAFSFAATNGLHDKTSAARSLPL